jgi:hypothetical protein
MKLPRLTVLLLLGLAASPLHALQQEQVQGPARVEVRSDSGAETLALSGTLTIGLTVEGSSRLEVEMPRAWEPGTSWTLVRREEPVRTALENERVRWQRTYLVAPQAPGTLTLPLPMLRYRDGRRDWTQVAWQPVVINVVTSAVADASKLREWARVEEVPAATVPESRRWLALVVVPVLALVATGVYLLARRSGGPRTRAPAEAALAHWQRVMATSLPEAGRGERFVTLLTVILRRYLQQKFPLPARRQTSAELVHSLTASGRLPDEQQQALAKILEQCDRIKFTGVAPAPLECRTLAEQVREFIVATQRLVPAAAPARGDGRACK